MGQAGIGAGARMSGQVVQGSGGSAGGGATAAGDLTAIRAEYMAMTQRKRLYTGILLTIFVLLMAGGFDLADARNAGGFWSGLHRVFDFPQELISEALRDWRDLPALMLHFLPALIETVNIAAVSTLLGALFAGLLSLLATPGLAPVPALVGPLRRILDITRAMPDVVIALVLIFLLGGGPVPAMLAIAFHSIGALGKQFSEVAENADLKPVEGLTSVGASWFQRVWLGIIPQVAPNWLSYMLMRFEINIRASAILGFVGAGGIGYELKIAIGWGQGRYAAAAAIFLLLFAAIVTFDQLSSYWRNKITGESH
jgi:phosphonate transport system permease protein